MDAVPAAVVLTGYPVDLAYVDGGAQRVAAQLCDRLAELGWTVQVIECGAWRESIGPEHTLTTGMADHLASAQHWRGAAPAGVMPAEEVGRAVGDARLVLVVDRAVGRMDTPAHRVLLLSNLAYENERYALAHGDYDDIWVASPYLARQLTAGAYGASGDVHVVPPVLAAPPCDPVAHGPLRALDGQLREAAVPLARRLLFPHRCDPGKDLTTALAVLRDLVSHGRWALIAVGPAPDGDPEGEAVADAARRDATAAGIADLVFWVPWLPQSEVFCLYRFAGATLMPSVLDEGFGLVAVESVMRGVPVVARPAGNLRVHSDRFTSIHLADEVTDMVRIVTDISGRAAHPAERRAVREAFSAAAQRAAVTAALEAAAVRT